MDFETDKKVENKESKELQESIDSLNLDGVLSFSFTSEAQKIFQDASKKTAAKAGSGAEQALPGLEISENKKTDKEVKSDQYKEAEKKRAEEFAHKHEIGSTLDRAMLTVATCPDKFEISAKPGQLKISSDNFARLAEAIPGAMLHETFRSILGGLKSGSIDGGRVSIEGKATVPVPLADLGVAAKLTLDNPNFNIVPDKENPKTIHLENIKGMSVDFAGVGGEIKKISLTLTKDGEGKPMLQIDIPKPEQKPAEPVKPNDYLSRFKKSVAGVVGTLAIPENSRIEVPIESADAAKVIERAFESIKNWTTSPEKNNPADLAAGIAGVNLKTVLAGAFDGIKSLNKSGELLEIQREKASTHDLGGMPLEIAQTVKAKIEADGKGVSISQIEGISMKLPLPAEVAKAVNLPQPFKANLKEVKISEPDKEGNRYLSIKTDSLLESVKIKVGPEMNPILDEKGNISVEFSVKHNKDSLGLVVSFNPKDLENPPEKGPDFKISLKGNDSSYLKLIESISGTKIDAPLKDMISNVSSISKSGDRVSIERDKASSHDLGGVILNAGRKVEFNLSQDGPSGVRLSKIDGIYLKLPVQLPQLVKDLGIDPGSHIHTKVKTFGLGSPDAQGRRKLLLETDHLLKQVGLMLGEDMKPALDPKGNWYMYGFVDNPLANKQMPMVLRMDKNNNLDMSTQELMRMGSLAAWQAKDNGGLEGAGFGVIAVATEAGAIALDVKDAVVEGAVVVKDAVVEGAVIVKDAVVEGAVVAKDAVVDSAVYVGGKVADGAVTVGGWVADGWNWVWGN